MLLQCTVVRTEAIDEVGLFDESYAIASDYPWMAELCRRNVMNLVSVPIVTKHEFGVGGEELGEGHLAWGKMGVRFYRDMLRGFDALFWDREERTAELRGIRAHWALQLAKAAVQLGDREEALRSLRAVDGGAGAAEAGVLRLLVTTVPHAGLVRALYRGWAYAAAAPARLRARTHRRAI
jgi:hypothetical protein